jgi:hypothetical protein
MSKFNLFSRSALSSMAAVAASAGLVPVAEGGAKPEDKDPEAGPLPADEDGDDAAAAGKPVDKKNCEEDAAADGTAAAADVVLVADAAAVANEQFIAGRNAERERTATVLGSDEGKANPAMAGWMLANNADASAASIVAGLKLLPTAMQSASTSAAIPDTNVNLGRGDAEAALGMGASGDDVWADVQGSAPKSAAPVLASDAGSMARAALASGASLVTTAASAPTTPAARPTGN